MIHPIVLYDAKILRDRSHSLDIATVKRNEVIDMIDDMFETMHKAFGIGLSAIQIALPVRVFIVEAHIKEEKFHLRETFINPTIIKSSAEKSYMTEGCLSIPGVHALVERPDVVTVQYHNYNFKKVTRTFENYAARIIQHEMDHLNGVLFIDNLEMMWRMMLDESLENIKTKEVTPEYLSK